MSKRIFVIPDFPKEDRLTPQLRYILKLLTDIENDTRNETFEIDFRKVSFCSCFLLGVLHSLVYQLRQKGREIDIETNKYGGVSDYLNTIHFNSEFLINNQSQIEELSQFEDKNYLPIFHFPTISKLINGILPSEACINVLLKLIFKKVNADGALKNDIDFIISEMTDNVIQHSDCDKGVISAQYYPSKKILDIVISDFGQGVLKSYKRNNNFTPKTNEDALRFAIDGKSSKNESETRGFGLEGARERIMSRNDLGRFMMWSGNSIYFEMKGNTNEMINLGTGAYYNGCLVFIRLCC